MTATITIQDATRIPPISHREATPLAEEEYRRFAAALANLGADDWAHPTDCDGWTVRDMAGHVLGAMRSAASVSELLSQRRSIKQRVKQRGENEVDAMTAVQIERTNGLTPSEVAHECAALVTAAAVGRRRTPAPLRRVVKIPVEIGSLSETWKLGYLVDTILTRDIFMHRIDLARAVDGQVDLSGSHSTRIVADIVGEWARRHGRPFMMTLTGLAGGRFAVDGDNPEEIDIDAVEFCRILSGRGTGDGLLRQEVPF